MKIKYALVLICIFSVVNTGLSCKKAIQEKYEDAIIQMMTSGAWKITSFKEGGTDITASFNGYISNFYDDKTMKATNGTVTYTGTWNGDINSQTFTANFTNAAEPIVKLNGTWSILSSSTESVGKFIQDKNGITYQMELTKN